METKENNSKKDKKSGNKPPPISISMKQVKEYLNDPSSIDGLVKDLEQRGVNARDFFYDPNDRPKGH